jgi:acyl-CoA synthetase (NDP forming)/GNAT superfamily N-acetyltransferase
MTEYPSEFEFDAMLTDGSVVHVRPITPDDAELEHEFILRVGPQSMYQRFFQVKRDLTPEELRYFTTVDYVDRMALIVLDGERMVAVGRYDVDPDKEPRTAEVAFLVEDQYQGRGIGTILLQHLTTYARLKGVTAFDAYVLADNFGMMRLFRSSGYHVVRSLDEDIYRVEFPIEYSPQARAADVEYERRAVASSITAVFFPRTVAVIGADQPADSIGGAVQQHLMLGGYTGIVYPVNPERTFVHSVRSYRTIQEVPDEIDLAFVAVPQDDVLDALADCGKKGVRAAVVVTGAEEGDTGPLVRVARRFGMRLLGPDSSGVVTTNTAVSLRGLVEEIPVWPGRVAIAAQSGALGSAILADAHWLAPGISSFASLGAGSDVTVNDTLIYWEDDPFTDVVLLYVESFGNPRRFGRLARRVARRKPIVAVKGGRSAMQSRSVPSQSTWLQHPDLAVEALFRASGVIRAETITEMFDVARLLALQPLPSGRRVAVAASSPGAASLAVGALEANGLEVPPTIGSGRGNPLVVAGDDPVSLDDLTGAGDVDAVVLVDVAHDTTPQDVTLLAVDMGAVRIGRDPSREGIPRFGYPESAARALTAAVRYAEWRSRPEGTLPDFPDVDRVTCREAVKRAVAAMQSETGSLPDELVAKVLDAYGIPRVEPGGPESVHEVFVAMVEDPIFGPLIVFGLAGMLTELAGDVAFRVNPLTDVDASEMVREARSSRVLFGFRDVPPGDVPAIEELLARTSLLIEDIPEIEELELGPVDVGAPGEGVAVRSATMRVRRVHGTFVPSRKDIPGRMLG